MKESGLTIKYKALELCIIKMEIYTMESFIIIKETVKESLNGKMGINI